jgi:HEAT repeat protein
LDAIKRMRSWIDQLIPTAKVESIGRAELLAQLASPRSSARWRAATALGSVDPGVEGIDALATTLTDADPILRWEAAAALARIGSLAARSALLAAATGDDPTSQAVALDGLGQLPPDPEIMAALQVALKSRRSAVRQSAAEALAHVAARSALRQVSKDTQSTTSGTGRPPPEPLPGADSVPALIKLLGTDGDPLVRRAAALALGHYGDPAAKAALEGRLKDRREDPLVRKTAEQALARLGGE